MARTVYELLLDSKARKSKPVRKDGRLSLTEDEYKVLIEMFNQMADRGIRTQSRIHYGHYHVLDVQRFIGKLLKVGLRNGWSKVPDCFKQEH